MAARTLYPKPECPKCGKDETFVKNTYYTDDGEILRNRKCYFCETSYWTLQPQEILLPPDYRLEFPKKFARNGNHQDRKKITIWRTQCSTPNTEPSSELITSVS